MHNTPDCFCAEDQDCDWVFELNMSYHRVGDKPGPNSSNQWVLGGIPQLLAQAIFQTSIAAVNENGAEVYKKWLSACVQGSDVEAIAAKVLEL